MTTGEKIASLRRTQGMSQEALADKLEISRQAVSKWEADIAAPSRDKLVDLADLFEVSTDMLLRPDEAECIKAVQASAAVPVLPVKTRMPWWAWVWLLVLTAGVIASLCWLGYAHAQLVDIRREALERPRTIVTMPSAPVDQAAQNITEHDIGIAYMPGTYSTASDRLRLTLRATPRKHDADETAQFIVRGTESRAVDAVWDGGQYSGETDIPLENTYSVSLAVTIGGTTETLALETLNDLTQRFGISVNASYDGSLGTGAGSKRNIRGNVVIEESRQIAWSGEGVLLADAKVTLYENGVAKKAVPCTFEPIGEGTISRTAYASFSETASDPIYFLVQLTDNFGRTSEQRVELP